MEVKLPKAGKILDGMFDWFARTQARRRFNSSVFLLIALAIVLSIVLAPCRAGADADVPLSWTEPTLNCDGSQLDDLAGYVVKWWDQDTPGTVVEQVIGLTTSTTITLIGNVEGKTYVFVVVSRDASGNRSDDIGGCGTSPQKVVGPFPATIPAPPPNLD